MTDSEARYKADIANSVPEPAAHDKHEVFTTHPSHCEWCCLPYQGQGINKKIDRIV